MRMSLCAVAIFGLFCVVLMTRPRAFATYYVSPTGASGNTGAIGSPWTLDCAIANSCSGGPNLAAGDIVYLRGGTYGSNTLYEITVNGATGNPIQFVQYPGEHATVDGHFDIFSGNNIRLMGFEIFDSTVEVFPAAEEMAINDHGEGNQFINLVIVDAQSNGVGTWADAGTGTSVVYGNIIQYFGHYGSSPGSHGHGIYMQANTPMVKTIRHNIILESFGGRGIHARTGGGALDNISMTQNVLGRCTALISEASSSIGLTYSGNVEYNISGASQKSEYQGSNDTGDPTSVFTLTNNYVSGGAYIMYQRAGKFINQGNTYNNRSDLIHAIWRAATPTPADFGADWNSNIYKKFDSGNFWFARSTNDGSSFTTYDNSAWTSTFSPVDAGSTFQSVGAPTGTVTRVWPNEYESGRGTVVILNWDSSNTVQVDCSSFLGGGDSWIARNAHDYYVDTFTGTGNQITFDMRASARTIRTTIENSTPGEPYPTFGVFVVSRTSQGTPPGVMRGKITLGGKIKLQSFESMGLLALLALYLLARGRTKTQ
jgi:hypothetical protein